MDTVKSESNGGFPPSCQDMNSSQTNYENSATREYLDVIREHVIHPLESTAVAESCFAAAMLIFGAIDGLGRLVHPDDHAGPGARFKAFLPRLGPRYKSLSGELWELRNSLAHNAMNVACFMSKTDHAFVQGKHLETFRDYLFIHTRQLLEEFKNAFHQLEQEMRTSAVVLQRAESRLERAYIPPGPWRYETVCATAPGPISFVQERKTT
jgi:hypothetical protein